jgi:hypothetical protein
MEEGIWEVLIGALPELGFSAIFIALLVLERINSKKMQEKWLTAYIDQTKLLEQIKGALTTLKSLYEDLKK